MEIKAKLNYLRIAPRKVRSVVDLIRGKEIREAEAQLKFVSRRASDPVLKLLKSEKRVFTVLKTKRLMRLHEAIPDNKIIIIDYQGERCLIKNR